MQNVHLPKRLFYGELSRGRRSHGGQKKSHKDTLKVSPKNFGFDSATWETLAQARSAWCAHIRKGAVLHEQSRIETAQRKHRIHKFGVSTQMFTWTICVQSVVEYSKLVLRLISQSQTHWNFTLSWWCHFDPLRGRGTTTKVLYIFSSEPPNDAVK